jgi:hypothetical protein
MKDKNIVSICSPTYEGIVYTYVMSDMQLEEYNYITRNGSLMNLKVFGQLNSKGLLNKRIRQNVSSIKL